MAQFKRTRTALLAALLGMVLIASFGLRSAAQPNHASYSRRVYPISILWPSRVAFPTTPRRKAFTADVSLDNNCPDFPGDCMILSVYADRSVDHPLATMKFTSSYGFFDLSIVDVTGNGQGDFFLITGEGHGTDVRAETLNVYERNGDSFKKILSTPVSDYFGVDRWWYEPIFADVNGDGVTDLALRLQHDDYRGHSVDIPSMIPKIKLKEFVYDKARGRMVLYHSER
jgi:hypothetical protein